MSLPSIKERVDLKDKKVLLRTDFNVPVNNGKIEDTYRIDRSLPTINYLKEKGAKVIIISHIWGDELKTLKPVFDYLKEKLEVKFVKDIEETEKIEAGEVFLLENLRLSDGEVNNDRDFSERLAKQADIYVNDAFAASHRNHASIVGLPKLLPSYTGLLFEEELKSLSKAFNPERPFVFILGGAKFETKIPLIKDFLEIADYIFVGGALANDFFKERGYEVGESLVSNEEYNLKNLSSQKLILPTDVIVRNEGKSTLKKLEEVTSLDNILDAGKESVEKLIGLVKGAKFVLWNGPLGDYEKGFEKSSEELAKSIASSEAESIIGGGDTLAVISKLGLEEKFSFISTAGGAMIEFLSKKTLPGIEAIKSSNQSDS